MKKKWGLEKDGLILKFNRLLQKKNHKKKLGQKGKCEIFFDASKYQVFADASGLNSSSDSVLSDNDISASSSEQNDNTLPTETNSSENVGESKSGNNVQSKKRSHYENCQVICIFCLQKTKENRPRTLSESESLSRDFAAIVYKDFFQDKVHLPNMICKCCFLKVENQSAIPIVNYDQLVENVKKSECFDKESNNVCEICCLASTSINPRNSPFLLKSKSKPGRPTIKLRQSKITEFWGKNKSKRQKFEMLNACLSPKAQQQYCAEFISKNAENGEVSLSRLHGPQMKFDINAQVASKAMISHNTLFKIKTEIQLSGNKLITLSKIIRDDCGETIKIEENFKDTVIKKGQSLKDFFKHEIVDMYVYEDEDFQSFKISDEGHLIHKTDSKFKHESIILPQKVGVPGLIQDTSNGKVLTYNEKTNEVTFSPKVKATKRKTRSTNSTPKGVLQQSWIKGPSDKNGWFRIIHANTEKYLSFSDKDNMTVEKLFDRTKKKAKKKLVKTKKVFVSCSDLDAFVALVCYERGYNEEDDIKIDIGLDKGGDTLKLMMSIEQPKKEQIELGTGSFDTSAKKRKRKPAEYLSKHLDSGVKKAFLIGVAKDVPEAYANLKHFLNVDGLQRLDCLFMMDYKCVRECFGMQTCAAKYSCPFCEGKAPFIEKARMRTFKNLRENYEGYAALVEKIGEPRARKRASDYFSVVRKSHIVGDFEDQWILWKAPMDELHIFIGIINKIFDELYKVGGQLRNFGVLKHLFC